MWQGRDDFYGIGGETVTFQILKLRLYERSECRDVNFKLGKVNIITGSSESGKSAIGAIIDYCLGDTNCNIAEGVIRQTVSYYGLLLQLSDEQIYIARKNPSSGKQTSTEVYVECGKELSIPSDTSFLCNTDVNGLKELLSRKIGIVENKHIPPINQTRRPLSANIRHALFYCFQFQDEIASRKFIFHKQSEDYVKQSIKDTLPYFLGVLDEKTLMFEYEKKLLTQDLTREMKEYNELLQIVGERQEKVLSLIYEAKEVGIIKIDVDNMGYDNQYNLLVDVLNWTPEDVYKLDDECYCELVSLQMDLELLREEVDTLNNQISLLKALCNDASNHKDDLHSQKNRLESIGLFEKIELDMNICPLCSGHVEKGLPSVDAIKKSIRDLNNAICTVTKETPRLQSTIIKLEDVRQKKKSDMKIIKSKIDGIYRQKQERHIRDITSKQAKVVGRISLWLESVNSLNNLEDQNNKIENIKYSIQEINKCIDAELIRSRQESILSIIQNDMTEWAKTLKLEYSGFPYRLDLKNLTVVIDNTNSVIPLNQMGSGANWVGIHIITYFALQKYFIMADRPVPRFIYLDQPSQVYFPSESDEKQQDVQKVRNIYEFIIDLVESFEGKLQVIITDHADYADEKFNMHIIESWHDDVKLIPCNWINK